MGIWEKDPILEELRLESYEGKLAKQISADSWRKELIVIGTLALCVLMCDLLKEN